MNLIVLCVLVAPHVYHCENYTFEAHSKCHDMVDALEVYYRGHVPTPKWKDRYGYLLNPPQGRGYWFEDWCNGKKEGNVERKG